jgi:pimeloyl-ACP methyl ester carboxylesterase
MKRSRFTAWVVGGGLVVLAGVFFWVLWSERNPEDERDIRIAFREQLETWFPEAMTAPSGVYGWTRHADPPDAPVTVVLVHGLDEPGDIWDDVIPALADEPIGLWELRYPNDQAIDRSGAYLADIWSSLPPTRPVILIGHSMGGLVAREFVGVWRHPANAPSRVAGAPVQAVFLVATPNHGSEWARLRSWLELRDQYVNAQEREFSLFASMRDGAGVAKVDLRPGSEFLRELNQRPWPEGVAVRLIAGDLMDEGTLRRGLESLLEQAPNEVSRKILNQWWHKLAGRLGDGVVTVESVRLEGLEPPWFCRVRTAG